MKHHLGRLFSLLIASSVAAACGEESTAESCRDYDPERTYEHDVDSATCAAAADGGASTGDASAADAGAVASACTCETLCQKLQGVAPRSCRFRTSTKVQCTVIELCPGGRRPELLAPPQLPFTDRRTAFLLGCAHMEAASVVAFERLAEEMRSLDAPDSMVARLCAAARDEVRHAHDMLALAGDHALPTVDAPSPGARSAKAIAVENAREGCIRETFAALVASRQAETAHDPLVRSIMGSIAADETRHAELSWELAAWLEARLSPADRRAVADSRRAEVGALRRELAARGLREDAQLGLPSAREAVALLDGLVAALPV